MGRRGSTNAARSRRFGVLPAARAFWRALTDRRAWRHAGRTEFAFATDAIAWQHGLRALRIVIASLALMMVPLALVMQFNPVGPHGVLARSVHGGAILAAAALGIWWLVRPWPKAAGAIAFLVISDAAVGLALVVVSAPEARICGTVHLAMLGMYAAFFLGWRILLLHCTYCLVLIASFTQFAVSFEGRTYLDLYIFTAPAIATVVGLPVMIQVVVEFGRLSMTRVVAEWHNDELTGGHNRRGMRFAVMREVARGGAGGVHVVAMIDMDGFKTYNDTHGHFAGDDLLRSTADALRSLGDVLVARNGGDEFALFKVCPDHAGAQAFVRAMAALIAPRADRRNGIVASMGVVLADAGLHDPLGTLATDADAALYEAKRSPDTAVVVHDRVGLAPDG